MRRLIASIFLSLDGFGANQNGDVDWVVNTFNDQMGKYAGDLMESMDTIVLERTYEPALAIADGSKFSWCG